MYAGVNGYPDAAGQAAQRRGAARRVRLVADRARRSSAAATASTGRRCNSPASARRRWARRGYTATTTYPREHRRQSDAGELAEQSVSDRHHAAAGQLARAGDRRRRRRSTSSIRTRSRATCSSTRSTSSASCRAASRSRSATRAAAPSTCRSAARWTRRSTSTSSTRSTSRSARRCSHLVPNPFFGNAAFGNLASSATIARGQLLRPFPQFDNVLAHRVNEARARYNAMIAALGQADAEQLGAQRELHVQPADGQPVRRVRTPTRNRSGSALDNYDLERECGLLAARRRRIA